MYQNSSLLQFVFPLLLLCAHGFNSISAQSGFSEKYHFKCGVDEVNARLLTQYPALEEIQLMQEELIYQQSQDLSKSINTNYTLPVVVHIIHNNGPENITDAQVEQGIQHLNEAFAAQNYYA